MVILLGFTTAGRLVATRTVFRAGGLPRFGVEKPQDLISV
jgi:hypothetical protein